MNRLTISLILFFLSAMASLKGVGVLGEAFSSVRLILGVQLADLQQTFIYACESYQSCHNYYKYKETDF